MRAADRVVLDHGVAAVGFYGRGQTGEILCGRRIGAGVLEPAAGDRRVVAEQIDRAVIVSVEPVLEEAAIDDLPAPPQTRDRRDAACDDAVDAGAILEAALFDDD